MGIIKTDGIPPFLRRYVQFVGMLIIIFLITRVCEYAYISFFMEQNLSLDLFFSRSVNFDILSILFFSIGLLIPSVIIALSKPKLALLIVRILGVLFVFINLAFTQYFLTNNALLNTDLFDFSFSEMVFIASNEFTYNRLVLTLSLFILLALTIYLLFSNFKRLKVTSKVKILILPVYLIAVIIALVNYNHTFKTIKYFDSNFEYLVGNSKSIYFVRSYFQEHRFKAFSPKDLKNSIPEFQSLFPNSNFPNQSYPLIHDEENLNVLGEYFTSSDTPPNVVIIISETLAATYSGKENTIGGSLTPFLDSLSEQGLTWSNFVSNAFRSFGVLPNILGSLPNGNSSRGFINMGNQYPNHKLYPDHTTLIDMLQSNGYHTNYYYGGWGYFDNIGHYLKEKGINNFISDEQFNTSKYKRGENVWGYDDKSLFQQTLDDMASQQRNKPYLTICQTISNHSPFNMVEKKYTEPNYVNSRLKELGITGDKIRKISNPNISSVLFADDAVKEFIQRYKKRSDYENTIFIITGDHAINKNLSDGIFESFRTPLVIYSPLLKKQQNFKGVSSHSDILPSLIALLEGNYALKFNSSKHWLGTGLDTNPQFRSNHFIPLEIGSEELPNAIIDGHVIYHGEVFKIKENMTIEKQKDKNIVIEIKSKFEAYRFLNNYVCIENKIWRKQ